jgi:general secretion pathway protein G
MNRRAGFTLIELVVVVMIIGVLVGIAAPRMLNIMGDATDNGARQSLGVLRDAIERYASENGGSYPSGTEAEVKDALKQYLRGPFPKSPVGAAPADALSVTTGNAALVSDNAGGWMYNSTTGEIIINCTDTSQDGSTAYSGF